MRVGLIVYGSLDTVSGGFLYDRTLVEYLRRAGDSVEVISFPWKDYLRHILQNYDQEIEDHLAHQKIDILLQDELNHPSLFLLNARLKKRLDVPFISIVHHLRGSEDHSFPLVMLYRLVERLYLNSVDGFIYNSHTTQESVEAFLDREVPGIVATPAGNRFGGTVDDQMVISRSKSDGPLRFLYVGNLIPRKGLHTLINALAVINDQNWTLRVVGKQDIDPSYTFQLRRLVEKTGLGSKISFLGSLSEKDLITEWRTNQVLVVPSTYEGFGIVYLEAMGFGMVPVGTTAGGAGEVIQSGKNGILVGPGDPARLAACLKRMCQDREYLLILSLAARRRYHDFPTWDESMARIRAFLIDF